MKTFSISIDIAAPPERVWSIISDVERWHEWTPSVRKIRRTDAGALKVGSGAWVRQPRLPPAFWRVTAIEPDREFTWTSKGPGIIVTARHAVEPMPRGSRATLSIQYDGLLHPLMVWMIGDLNDRYLALEASGLKRRGEEDRSPQSKPGTIR
jgi:uncharacterized protein YndB with AHSA1/START domain